MSTIEKPLAVNWLRGASDCLANHAASMNCLDGRRWPSVKKRLDESASRACDAIAKALDAARGLDNHLSARQGYEKDVIAALCEARKLLDTYAPYSRHAWAGVQSWRTKHRLDLNQLATRIGDIAYSVALSGESTVQAGMAPPPMSDERRSASWFNKETDGGLYPDLLKQQRERGRINGEKVGHLWHYEIDSVCRKNPQYAPALRDASERERTGKNGGEHLT